MLTRVEITSQKPARPNLGTKNRFNESSVAFEAFLKFWKLPMNRFQSFKVLIITFQTPHMWWVWR